MSQRGLSHLVQRLAVFSTCCCLIFVAAAPARAQVLDQLSEFLQRNQNQQPADELPAPAKRAQENTGPVAPAGGQPAAGQQADALPKATPAQRIYLGLEAEQALEGIGVRVATVTRDSPAWKAGFRVDDRILGINGFAIGTMEHMIEQLSKARPGQSVNFLVNRDGRNRDLVAVLMNGDVADQIQNRPTNLANAPAWLGVTTFDLTNSFREQFGIAAFRGAAVTQVVTGSPAHQAGIRPGDAIVEAGGLPIETAGELQRWVEQSKPGDQGQVVYYRGAGRQTTKVVLIGDPQLLPAQQPLRPQAFPNANGTSASRPTIPTTNPKQPLPIDPTTNPDPSITPDPNAPLVLGTDQTPMQSTEQGTQQATPRELALEAEIAELKKQLAEAQAKLTETKQQLDNILRALKD